MSPDDAFILFAEIAAALAGFAGVASAFSGRDRDFGFLDRGRIRAIVGSAAIVLMGCFAFVTVSLGDGSLAQATRGAALASLVACIPLHVFVVVPAVRDVLQPDSDSEPWVIYLSTFLVVVVTLLYGWVVLFPTSLGILGGCYSIQLAQTLWMFFRLLTRPR